MADDEGHNPEGEITRLIEKLSDRRRHVAFLLGAGTGCAGGLPDLSGLTMAVGEQLEEADRSDFAQLAEGRNLEEILTHLRLVTAALAGSDEQVFGLSADRALYLDRRICSTIAAVIVGSETDEQHHVRFATWLAGAQYDRPVEIFTTNYDLLVEDGLEEVGIPYFDGFLGVFRGRFRTDLVDEEVSGPRVRLPAGWVRLWKLHGSVSWVVEDLDEEGRRSVIRVAGAEAINPEKVLAIYPSLEKYEESRRLPFVALADRFRRSLATPDSLFLVCGYSFGDQHVNELLFDAIRLHARSEVVATFYAEIPDAVATKACELPNLTVFGSHEAIVSGVRAQWAEPSDPSIPWNDDGLRLGDFAALSQLLVRTRSGARDHGVDVDDRPA